MRTSWGSATDRGAVRAVNEDAVLTYPPLFMVADGMGGHDAGDLAARIAVESFAQLAGQQVVNTDQIKEAFARASARIRNEFTQGRQGGTTVAGVALSGHDETFFWLVFNIGDSRVYRWTAATGLEQISVDHSVVQELVDRGALTREEADRHPERHVLTRALGTRTGPEADYWMLPAVKGDRILVCTDGLTRELSHEQIATLLGNEPQPQAAATQLVNEAVGRGARDNVTVVVVDLMTVGFDAEHSTKERTAGGRPTTGRLWDEMLDGVTVPRALGEEQ